MPSAGWRLHDTGHEQVDTAVDVLRKILDVDVIDGQVHEDAIDEARAEHEQAQRELADRHDDEIKALRLELDPATLTSAALIEHLQQAIAREVSAAKLDDSNPAAREPTQPTPELPAPPNKPKRSRKTNFVG